MQKKFFVLAAAALAFTACNKEANRVEPELVKGDTYVALSLQTAPLRLDDAQADEAGRGAEAKVATLDLFGGITKSWALGNLTAQGATYTTKAFATEAGVKTMGLVINKGTLSPVDESSYFGEPGEAAQASIATASTDDSFVMTSEFKSNNVEAGVSEDDANAGTKNSFAFDMERMVAQGKVAIGSGIQKSGEDYKVEGVAATIKSGDLKYAAVNGAVKTYVFLNKAGKRALTEANGLYDGFASYIDGYAVNNYATCENPETVKDHLVRLGNVKSASDDALGNYAAVAVSANATEANNARGIYFFENSAQKSGFTKSNKDYGFYRLAYAKVYATFVPEKVLTLEDGVLKEKVYEAGTNFYMGEKDRRLYDSKEAAKASTVAGAADQKAYTYEKGRCAYRALWNRQTLTADPKTVVNADARRNNIYLLEINGFKGIGMPWDPSDPQDPNLPKPTDPDEPTDPVTPPDIEKEDTYMRVTATILPWNKVSRTVTLE